jgi:hypothetical protein
MEVFLTHNQQNEKGKGGPAIRPGVLCAVLGVAVICVFAIIMSRSKKSEPAGTAAPSVSVPRQDSPPAPSNSFRAARTRSRPEIASTPDAASINETQISRATEMAWGISNELRGARERLADLRDTKHYADEHPEVQKELARIKSLEQSAAVPPEFLGLVKARAELAGLRVRFDEPHPDVQEQLRVIESFERSAAAGERSELAEARAQLQRLRVRFSDVHPAVQSQFQKVTELQK